MSFNHNKKRNSGLLYEFLIRKLSEAAIDENASEYDKTFSLLRKYYSAGQPLSEEKQFFDVIISTTRVSNGVARGIVAEVVGAARLLNHRKIDIKKSNLIKEINVSFDKGFFNAYKLEDYRVYASVQLLINGCAPKKTIVESAQRVQLEEALIEHMTNRDEVVEEKIEEHDDLVYMLAMKKFNEKYQNSLNGTQKKILREYVEASMSSTRKDRERLVKTLKEERDNILKLISHSFMTSEIAEDEKMSERLSEAREMLDKMNVSFSTASVEDMMLFAKLAEEISS